MIDFSPLATATATTAGGIQQAAEQNPAAMVLLGLGILGVIYYSFLRPKARGTKRRRDPLATPPSRAQSLASERAAERQMQSVVLELEALSRKMGGELDTKAAKLRALVDQAEAAAARLEAAVGKTAQAKAGDLADALAKATDAKVESGLAGLGHHRDIYAMADAGKDVHEISRRTARPTGEVELILALRGT